MITDFPKKFSVDFVKLMEESLRRYPKISIRFSKYILDRIHKKAVNEIYSQI